MSAPDPQLALFLAVTVLADARRDRHEREIRISHSRAKRNVASALGQIGDQLAMALLRGDELVTSVEQQTSCQRCGPALAEALDVYRRGRRIRTGTTTYVLPVIGWAS